MSDTVTIRLSTSHDRDAILILAELAGGKVPSGKTLLAIVNGELRAALPLEGGEALADPFRATAELVELLYVRNGLLHGRDRARRARLLSRLWAFLRADVSGRGWMPGDPIYWPS